MRICVDKDARWLLLRAGLPAQVVISHSEGDQAWAEQAAKDMKQMETRYHLQMK